MKAYAEVRANLTAGLKGGESQQELNARIFSIFRDPARAQRIGQTEAARALNTGGMMLAKA